MRKARNLKEPVHHSFLTSAFPHSKEKRKIAFGSIQIFAVLILLLAILFASCLRAGTVDVRQGEAATKSSANSVARNGFMCRADKQLVSLAGNNDALH